MLSAKPFIVPRPIAIDEIVGAHSLLAFHLQFPDLQSRAVRETQQQAIVVGGEVTPPEPAGCRNRSGRVDVQHLAAKAGKRPRPGLKSTQAVPGIHRAAREIDEPVRALENGSERRLSIVLRTRRYRFRSSGRQGWRSSAQRPTGPAVGPASERCLPARSALLTAAGCRRCRGRHRCAWWSRR